jgi:DNA modification methylase
LLSRVIVVDVSDGLNAIEDGSIDLIFIDFPYNIASRDGKMQTTYSWR